MSLALAEWTLQQVRDHARTWRAAALRLPRVGIAVSLDLLTLPMLFDILRKGIRAGLAPQYLGVEFRGGADIDPAPDQLEAFAGLKKMGVRFLLDQFCNVRRDAMTDVKEALKEKVINDDQERQAAQQIQDLTDKHVADIERISSEKQKEIMEF